MRKQIHFLLSIPLEGYELNPNRPEGLSFTDMEKGLKIEILGCVDKSDPHFRHCNLKLHAKISCDVTERQCRFIDALLNDRIIDPDETPITLPYSVNDRELVASDGKIAEGYFPISDFLPEDLQKLCISIDKILEKHAVRFVRLLRWLENANGSVRIREDSSCIGLSWKTTQEQYYNVPWPKLGPVTITTSNLGRINWTEENQQMLAYLWRIESEQEPLGHQLLREAKSILGYSHRSALLICYSALEVGIKQHISNCVTDASWLVMHAPSPPLYKLLWDYLPKIHNGKRAFEKWSEIKPELKLVTQFVDDRNKLAHRGENIAGSVDEYLRITQDLLFAFDVFEGHAWAETRVSRRFGELLDWNVPKDPNPTIEVFYHQ